MTKTCCKCKEIKELVEFYLDARRKYGIQTSCKNCHKARKQTPEYKDYDKSRRQSTEYKESQKDYRFINKEKINLQKQIREVSKRQRQLVAEGKFEAPDQSPTDLFYS